MSCVCVVLSSLSYFPPFFFCSLLSRCECERNQYASITFPLLSCSFTCLSFFFSFFLPTIFYLQALFGAVSFFFLLYYGKGKRKEIGEKRFLFCYHIYIIENIGWSSFSFYLGIESNGINFTFTLMRIL